MKKLFILFILLVTSAFCFADEDNKWYVGTNISYSKFPFGLDKSYINHDFILSCIEPNKDGTYDLTITTILYVNMQFITYNVKYTNITKNSIIHTLDYPYADLSLKDNTVSFKLESVTFKIINITSDYIIID